MSEQLFRVSEVAELASCGRSTIYRAIAEGRLRAVGDGSMVRVPESAIEEWLRPVVPRSPGPMPAPRARQARGHGKFAPLIRLDDRRAR